MALGHEKAGAVLIDLTAAHDTVWHWGMRRPVLIDHTAAHDTVWHGAVLIDLTAAHDTVWHWGMRRLVQFLLILLI